MMEKENETRTRIVGVRFTTGEYAKIEKKFKATTCRKLSEYLRKMVLEKAVRTNYRNASMDEFMIEIIRLRTELNALGNNFNQSIKKLHLLREIPEFRNWILSTESQRDELVKKVGLIQKYMDEITSKWLRS